jgi:hypothetical protein
MLKSSPIFRRNVAHLVFKKDVLKKRTVHFQGLSALNVQKHFWFVLSFEHVNFTIDGKYYKKFYDNPNYYASLVIFQTYKNVVLRSVHSLGWLLWLCFYPLAFWNPPIQLRWLQCWVASTLIFVPLKLVPFVLNHGIILES